MTESTPTICLIDGSGYIFRAFYALPPMHRTDGIPTNAVYGFTSMMLNLLQENCCQQIVVIFDAKRENFRNQIYPEYKANRLETPPELVPQFKLIRSACEALNVYWTEMEGYEADDLIATYTRIALEKGQNVRIVSADKDLMQLMQKGVILHDPMKKRDLSEEDVLKKFGVTPDKVIEVQALMGDSSDNVPGAEGVGPKTAAALIQQFGCIENLYQHLDEIKSIKQRDKLAQDQEKVFISKKLVSLDKNVPVKRELTDFTQKTMDKNKILFFLRENNFPSLAQKITVKFNFSESKTDIPDASQITRKELKTELDIQNLIDLFSKEKMFAFDVKYTNNQLTDLFFSNNAKTIYHLPLQSGQPTDLFGFTESEPRPEIIKGLKKLFTLPVMAACPTRHLYFRVSIANFLSASSAAARRLSHKSVPTKAPDTKMFPPCLQ